VSFRITVREGPQVRKLRAEGLAEALDLVEREARALETRADREPVRLRTRTFEPRQQVAGRVELAGPGLRAGIDVRGDGASEAWTGRVRRSLVEQRKKETACAALRRVLLAQSTSVEP
jgi:hypothetical protein